MIAPKRATYLERAKEGERERETGEKKRIERVEREIKQEKKKKNGRR